MACPGSYPRLAPLLTDPLQSAADALANAQQIVCLTGAGISAASGVPTFRDAQTGLWAKYRAEDLATPEAFARDPALVWQWYQWRRELVATAQPNAAHHALVKFARMRRLSLITQNVDDLHQRAGSDAVIALHGALFDNVCTNWHPYPDAVAGLDQPPSCPRCGAPVRPGVVWFGGSLPEQALRQADVAIRAADAALVIGTSSLVWPAAGFAEAAVARGIPVIEVNPQATPFTPQATYHVRGPAEQMLPRLLGTALESPTSSNLGD